MVPACRLRLNPRLMRLRNIVDKWCFVCPSRGVCKQNSPGSETWVSPENAGFVDPDGAPSGAWTRLELALNEEDASVRTLRQKMRAERGMDAAEVRPHRTPRKVRGPQARSLLHGCSPDLGRSRGKAAPQPMHSRVQTNLVWIEAKTRERKEERGYRRRRANGGGGEDAETNDEKEREHAHAWFPFVTSSPPF